MMVLNSIKYMLQILELEKPTLTKNIQKPPNLLPKDYFLVEQTHPPLPLV